MTENSIPLPDGVELGRLDGVPVLRVSTPASSATIHLDGAQVTSWVPAGRADVLWLSPGAVFAEGTAIRGGIPLIGPWFGPGRDGATSPAHGWLRTARWELEAAERLGDAVTLVLGLTGADPSGAGVTAQAFVAIGEHLTVELSVRAGAVPLELESALHTYLAVDDVREVRLEGFDGAPYLDNMEGLARRVQDERFVLTGATDRVFEVDDEVAVLDPGAGRVLREEPAGSTRTVVWNPWEDGARDLADVPDEDWSRFVCVETAAVKDGYVPLAPGDAHALRVRLVVEDL